jgi:anti-sigma factor RsiW
MNHSEAVSQMATERYLLDEMTPDAREAFEEHVFECQECALDLRATMAFVDEAKAQLPEIMGSRALPGDADIVKRRKPWFSWLSPAFAVPAFAALLVVIGYQNLATIPALRSAAAQPQVLPWTSVHVGTRGAAPIPVTAGRNSGMVLLIDLPQQAGYASFAFELYDAQGKRVWKSAPSAPASPDSDSVSVVIPGRGLQQGTYTLAISGISSSGAISEVGRRIFDVRLSQ